MTPRSDTILLVRALHGRSKHHVISIAYNLVEFCDVCKTATLVKDEKGWFWFVLHELMHEVDQHEIQKTGNHAQSLVYCLGLCKIVSVKLRLVSVRTKKAPWYIIDGEPAVCILYPSIHFSVSTFVLFFTPFKIQTADITCSVSPVKHAFRIQISESSYI